MTVNTAIGQNARSVPNAAERGAVPSATAARRRSSRPQKSIANKNNAGIQTHARGNCEIQESRISQSPLVYHQANAIGPGYMLTEMTEALNNDEKFDAWVKAGYVDDFSAGLTAEDMGTSFIAGDYPMLYSGSWWYGRFTDEIEGFEWGIFPFPGADLHPGSSGNIWVVPTASENQDLAYQFIEITMRPEIQATLGNNGGVPVAADPADIEDEKSTELISLFNEVNDIDGLAFYPDWPAPGFYDDLASAIQQLINQSASVDDVLTQLQTSYDTGVDDFLN
jgi:ABC-type glycerol-3-phosphate transport system substrate-binding protein